MRERRFTSLLRRSLAILGKCLAFVLASFTEGALGGGVWAAMFQVCIMSAIPRMDEYIYVIDEIHDRERGTKEEAIFVQCCGFAKLKAQYEHPFNFNIGIINACAA